MLYQSGDAWLGAPEKRVLLFGMSGLGKTFVSNVLRASGDWFHYSIDYRIGTRYMGEWIDDNLKREAMKNPFLAPLLKEDAIGIASNITFQNLSPLSTYMGKPGDPAKGGIPMQEYKRRQQQHRAAEIAALVDTPRFAVRAHDIYGYAHFVCDSGGSICEVVDPADPDDPVMETLEKSVLPIWIEGGGEHAERLVERFDRAPKPMYFNPDFLDDAWARYLKTSGERADSADPDAFMRFAYRGCLDQRQPRYRAMADRWGVRVSAADMAEITTAETFIRLVARAIDAL